jgi:hypothetical protein
MHLDLDLDETRSSSPQEMTGWSPPPRAAGAALASASILLGAGIACQARNARSTWHLRSTKVLRRQLLATFTLHVGTDNQKGV